MVLVRGYMCYGRTGTVRLTHDRVVYKAGVGLCVSTHKPQQLGFAASGGRAQCVSAGRGTAPRTRLSVLLSFGRGARFCCFQFLHTRVCRSRGRSTTQRRSSHFSHGCHSTAEQVGSERIAGTTAPQKSHSKSKANNLCLCYCDNPSQCHGFLR